VDALGVRTHAADIAERDFAGLPTDFTYLLHIAAEITTSDYERGLRVNAEGTGFLLEHCRTAKAALVMSSVSTYKPNPDPWHAYREDDPLGDVMLPGMLPYSITKIAQEAVARFCARSFDLPVTIARMGTAYSDRGGLPIVHMDAINSGQPVYLRHDPLPYSPIHEDDICDQIEALLDAASVPATIVNWAGDEPVSAQEWCAYLGKLVGKEPQLTPYEAPGASLGSVADSAKRVAITGPCRVRWHDGFRRVADQLAAANSGSRS
jgi:nucleoside-diphosphate-sugar epimerase